METLKSKREFDEVFCGGKRYSHRLVRATVLSAESLSPKLAFVAAKRLGSAPLRNRSKRVLREAARLLDLSHDGLRIILFATKDTAAAHPAEVASALEKLLNKAGISC